MHHAALIRHSPIALKTQHTQKQQMRHSLHRLQLDIPRQTTTDCTAQSPKKITTTSRRHRRRVGIRRYLTTIYIRRILLHASVFGIALRKPYIWEFQKEKLAALHSRTSGNGLQKTPQKRRGGKGGHSTPTNNLRAHYSKVRPNKI